MGRELAVAGQHIADSDHTGFSHQENKRPTTPLLKTLFNLLINKQGN